MRRVVLILVFLFSWIGLKENVGFFYLLMGRWGEEFFPLFFIFWFGVIVATKLDYGAFSINFWIYMSFLWVFSLNVLSSVRCSEAFFSGGRKINWSLPWSFCWLTYIMDSVISQVLCVCFSSLISYCILNFDYQNHETSYPQRKFLTLFSCL